MFDVYREYAGPLMPDDFGLKMILFIGGMVAILFLVNLFLSKVLGVEKRSLMKANHVNDRHKKVEFYIGIAGAIGVGAAAIYGYGKSGLYPIYATVMVALISTLYRAYMERKYAENPREYIFTLLEFPLIILFILSLGSFLFPEIPLF
ncbi:DUF4181 domain-containing protein [Planococcus halotolerans]|uniref:DUF4181 domain-containing protein n=1 Tax=Planococcus halotolerans TaxID=2233542 RepID=UPI00109226CD|nr:DUF4181 domain-containing protein [Planococcus halotolerans]QHJ69855.1 DUF4181 domain-containing protein [Planococcus halotolerans]